MFSLAAAFKFITSPLGKTLGIGMMIATLIALGYVAWHNHNEVVAAQERLRNENAQLQQTVRDNQELQKKTEELEGVNRDILQSTQAQNERVVERHTEVRTYLDSKEAHGDNRESSNVIKNTIRILRDED